MAYNNVEDILSIGYLSFDDGFNESDINLAMMEASDEIDLRIPPLTENDKGYERYQRRLPLIKRAHAYLSLSNLFVKLSFSEIKHTPTGDAFSALDISFGPKVPDVDRIADYWRKLSSDYRSKAENLIKKCHDRLRVPTIKRPKALSI